MNPQDAAASDNTYAFLGSPVTFNTYYLRATGFGFVIPSGAVIEGIRVDVEEQGVYPVFDVAARIVKGGAIGATDESRPDSWTFPDNVVTYGGSSDLWGETWTAADINAANFGFALAVFGSDTLAFVDAISIKVFYSSSDCGNNQIDLGEQCDDGNAANGDCCSSSCQFETAGAPCSDATVCNGDETCDGVGACLPGTSLDCDDDNLCTQDSCDPVTGCANAGSPVGGCRTALKSTLIMKNESPDTKDTLSWKWIKGQSTTQAEFGVPTATTQYALCIYAGAAAALAADYAVPGGAVKWSPIGTTGYKYKDSGGSADGITKIVLKGGAQDKSKCLVKGKGGNLDDVVLEDLDNNSLVIVQLVNDSTSVCFESTFTPADFITVNDPMQFKARTP